jgi:hypothetical protein
MRQFKINADGYYAEQLRVIALDQVVDFFDRAQKWHLGPALAKGGSVIFPHTLISTCGDQVAAVVQGCLDSGARRVIVLGVLHSFGHTHVLSAREKSFHGEDISQESCWGIFGPLFPGDQAWKTEYSLYIFTFLWNFEVKRRGLKNPPELIHVYPCLANKEPWKMPGIEQLKSYLPNSVVVATTDFCHHGVAYKTPKEKALPISDEAEMYARATIEKGLKILERPNYLEYFNYSRQTSSDGSDVGQVLTYLKGPLQSKILDLRLVDTSYLFEGDPSPSWVAATLIEMARFKL